MSGVQLIEVDDGEAGARLDRWFKRRFPHIGRGQLEKLLRTGQIRVDGGRVKSATRLEAGQQVRVPPLPDADAPPQPRAPFSDADKAFMRSLVIHEDEDVLALNKPAGLAVQGGSKTTRHLDALIGALARSNEEPARLAHRLDRDTSGVIVFGKSPAAAGKLARAFADHSAAKTYWAITIGAPNPRLGLIKGFIRKAARAGGDREAMTRAAHGDEGAVYARTRYAVMANAGQRAAWVALRPETGRTHQLRFHMAELGCAILGDRKYTCHRPAPEGAPKGLMLHARSLELAHPRGGALHLEAALPAHMSKAFELFGFEQGDYVDPFDET